MLKIFLIGMLIGMTGQVISILSGKHLESYVLTAIISLFVGAVMTLYVVHELDKR